ncbi:MAG: aminoacetone oxidase family FAD-binding enzyme, partial [Lachnospiraceae bacterium]
MSNILIVGGGAAGMLASIFAARNGHTVSIFEKNEKLGKKLFITGKGRCNITNACDMEVLLSSVMSNSKFLYSSFYGFSNEMAVDFFEELGVATTVERGNRVFPSSNHSSDVIGAMTREMKRLGIQIHYNSIVTHVASKEGRFHHIELENHNTIMGDSCIIATGGISYQLTGSTGDGYRFATELGHQVTKLSPSLVPLSIEETYAKELQGLSLRNITATILDGKKQLYSDFGEMLFTHYGVS